MCAAKIISEEKQVLSLVIIKPSHFLRFVFLLNNVNFLFSFNFKTEYLNINIFYETKKLSKYMYPT